MSRRTLKDNTFLRMTIMMATLGTCSRRRVGCIMTDERDRIIASGYNGPASGMDHCEAPTLCPGAKMKSGEGLSTCEAIHAEANALIQCQKPDDIRTVYCTASPCRDCVKLIMNTGCERIIFSERYPHPEAEELWREHGGEWIQL